MEPLLERSYESLAEWCRSRDYAGHDPFDGLNSRLFQATPFANSRLARLAWTQLFKRSPINFRGLARVPAESNSKGTALFALAALSQFRRTRTKKAETEARRLLNDLLAARLAGFSGDAWGYNFDWQGRAFFAPKGTPTIVPTAFAVRALIEASDVFQEKEFLQSARSACDFILKDLNRNDGMESELCFSYSPIDRTRVFNASLLAAESLAVVSQRTGEKELTAVAIRAARYVVHRQRADGSWAYGGADFQSWADNFHTAFVLSSLVRIAAACDSQDEFGDAIQRGYEFWRKSFFLAEGWPKYYHDRLYPVDAHSAGAAIATLLDLKSIDNGAIDFARTVTTWSINHLQDPAGYFYYQRRSFHTVRTPYMRWSQAWMMYAMSRLLEESKQL